MNANNRIISLARVLGSEYFSIEVMEPPPTYGESMMETQTLRDVTPERFSKLDKEVAKGKSEIVSVMLVERSYVF